MGVAKLVTRLLMGKTSKRNIWTIFRDPTTYTQILTISDGGTTQISLGATTT